MINTKEKLMKIIGDRFGVLNVEHPSKKQSFVVLTNGVDLSIQILHDSETKVKGAIRIGSLLNQHFVYYKKHKRFSPSTTVILEKIQEALVKISQYGKILAIDYGLHSLYSVLYDESISRDCPFKAIYTHANSQRYAHLEKLLLYIVKHGFEPDVYQQCLNLVRKLGIQLAQTYVNRIKDFIDQETLVLLPKWMHSRYVGKTVRKAQNSKLERNKMHNLVMASMGLLMQDQLTHFLKKEGIPYIFVDESQTSQILTLNNKIFKKHANSRMIYQASDGEVVRIHKDFAACLNMIRKLKDDIRLEKCLAKHNDDHYIEPRETLKIAVYDTDIKRFQSLDEAFRTKWYLDANEILRWIEEKPTTHQGGSNGQTGSNSEVSGDNRGTEECCTGDVSIRGANKTESSQLHHSATFSQVSFRQARTRWVHQPDLFSVSTWIN